MTRADAAPPLVVWLGEAMFTFGPGREVTVGRGSDADIRVEGEARQAISRVHLILRPHGTEWVAVDNKSRNGCYVDGARIGSVPIDDDTRISLGAPDGPPLTFRINTAMIRLPQPSATPTQPPPHRSPPPPHRSPPVSRPSSPSARQPTAPPRVPSPPPTSPQRPPAGPPSQRPAAPLPPTSGPRPPTVQQPPPPRPSAPAYTPAPNESDDDVLARMTGAVKNLLPQRTSPPPPGAATIGRHSSSTVRIADPLASRTHAYLQLGPAGTELRDGGSNNGTFVNGARVATATLRPGDVITIGTTDLVFTGGLTVEPRTATPAAGGLRAEQIGLSIDGHQLLTNVSFAARPGTLTAVIGPSGAGKTTLIKLLAGATAPTSGYVTFDEHDVHAEYASMRARIGVVPQDDVVHRQLTVDHALSYAAQLRLPPDTSKSDRAAIVDRVLGELELTAHRAKRVSKLSGGQRKRASVALELLTGPSLLILDEPTSGLDPALDRQVMSMLRRLADAGRTVIVVTHSLTYLSMCDQVLLLAPGGKTAYAGSPAAIGATIGTTDWADIFAWVSSRPDDAHAAFLARTPGAARPAARPVPPGPLGQPTHTSTGRQMGTLARRQLRLVAADRGYTAFLVLLPFILGALALVVPGKVGLGLDTASNGADNEPTQLLILANIAAVFMGTALTIRDLVGERSIFRREQSVGLSTAAYLASKIAVYSGFAALQTAIVTAIIVYGKGGPTQGALLLGNPVYDLYLTLALTAIVSAILGLLCSALARSTEQILPMLVVILVGSIVFSGGLIPVTARIGLDQASWFVPARWGFAAAASTIDLLTVAPLMDVNDKLWHHTLNWWLLDMGVLLLLGVVLVVVVGRRLRQDPAEAGNGARGAASKVATVVVVVVLLVGFVAGLTVLTRGGGKRDISPTAAMPGTPTQGTAPPQQAVAADKLAGILLDASTLAATVQASGLTTVPTTAYGAGTAVPPTCAGTVDAGNAATYAGTPATGTAGSTSSDPTNPNVTVTQFLTSYGSANDAASVQDTQVNSWRGCANATVEFVAAGQPERRLTVGQPRSGGGRLTVTVSDSGRFCQHVLTTDSNVVVDVQTCSSAAEQHAEDVVKKITERIA